jgi:anti-sigma factor (TIGR02949 family)
MKVISFGDSACEKIRRYLDSYVNNELTVETNHEVVRHLESCSACAGEAEDRSRLKARLKSAVTAQNAPADLSEKIREQIRQQDPRRFASPHWTRWGAVAAAVVLASFGTWMARGRWGGGDIYSDGPTQDAYIQKLSRTVAVVLRVGLRDHVHCSVLSGTPKKPPALDQVAQDMGSKYKGLVPLVKASIPPDYRIMMGHQCDYGGRRFVHLAMTNGTSLMSLVIARKERGESLATLAPTLRTASVNVYQAAAQQYEIAGFETEAYLAFIVSDLNAAGNLQVAGNLAPSVHSFLSKVPRDS